MHVPGNQVESSQSSREHGKLVQRSFNRKLEGRRAFYFMNERRKVQWCKVMTTPQTKSNTSCINQKCPSVNDFFRKSIVFMCHEKPKYTFAQFTSMKQPLAVLYCLCISYTCTCEFWCLKHTGDMSAWRSLFFGLCRQTELTSHKVVAFFPSFSTWFHRDNVCNTACATLSFRILLEFAVIFSACLSSSPTSLASAMILGCV